MHTYTHTFYGSINVSQRQQDVEQVINTQITYTNLHCKILKTLKKNSVINHLYTYQIQLQSKWNVYVGIF